MLYQQSDDDHVTGSFDKEAFYDKKNTVKKYISVRKISSHRSLLRLGGAAWCEFVSQIFILTTDSDILSKEFFPHMHFSADSF